MKFIILYILVVITGCILFGCWLDRILGSTDPILKWCTQMYATWIFALFYRKIYDEYFK